MPTNRRLKLRDFGTCITLNSDAFGQVGDTSTTSFIQNTMTGFTIVVWCRPDVLLARAMIGSAGALAEKGWSFEFTAAGSVAIGSTNGTSQTSQKTDTSIKAIPNKWQMMVWRGTSQTTYQLTQYVDGSKNQTAVTSYSTNGTLSTGSSTRATCIGSYRTTSLGTAAFAGSITEAFVFNRTLSDQELDDLYYDGTIPSGRVLHTLLNEGAGTVLNDQVAIAGTLSDASKWNGLDAPMQPRRVSRSQTSSIGGASVATASIAWGAATEQTYECWAQMQVQPPAGSPYIFGELSSNSGANNGCWVLYFQDGRYHVAKRNSGATITLDVPAALGQSTAWNHLVATISTTDGLKFFFNGQLCGALATTSADTPGSQIFNFAQRGTATGFNVSGAKVWNRRLSVQEVKDRFYTARLDASMSTSLMMNLVFSEGTGTTAADTSGNGNNATVSGSAWSIANVAEKSRFHVNQNLLVRVIEFDNASWSKTNVTVTANTTANPLTGAVDADTLVDTVGSAGHFLSQVPAFAVAGDQLTFSMYAKAGTRQFLLMFPNGGAVGCTFDLTNGKPLTPSGVAQPKMVAVSGQPGWYRCSVTFTYDGSNGCRIYLSNADNTPVYTGDGLGTIIIYGAQVTQGADTVPFVTTAGTIVNTGATRFPVPDGRNWLPRSDQFGSWTQTNTTTTSDAVANPLDGTVDADRINDTVANAAHQIALSGISTNIFDGQRTCLSVYVKAGTKTGIVLAPNGAASTVAVDLSTTPPTTSFISQGIGVSHGVEPVVSAAGQTGWYRAWIVFVNPVGGVPNNSRIYMTIATSYNGDGTGTIFLYGAQLELGDGPTAYKKTNLTAGGGGAIDNGGARTRLSRENLIKQSEGLTTSPWATTSVTVTAGQTDPNGGSTAFLIAEAATTNNHRNTQSSAGVLVVGQTYTLATIVKDNTRRYAVLRAATSAGYEATFDLQGAGAITNTSGCTAAMQAIGGGWFLCSITFVAADATSVSVMSDMSVAGGASASYAGDITKSYFAWKMWLSRGTRPGEYEQSTTATIVKGAPRHMLPAA